jgi:hypothetical protein
MLALLALSGALHAGAVTFLWPNGAPGVADHAAAAQRDARRPAVVTGR